MRSNSPTEKEFAFAPRTTVTVTVAEQFVEVKYPKQRGLESKSTVVTYGRKVVTGSLGAAQAPGSF
jgi:hypothetical protein